MYPLLQITIKAAVTIKCLHLFIPVVGLNKFAFETLGHPFCSLAKL